MLFAPLALRSLAARNRVVPTLEHEIARAFAEGDSFACCAEWRARLRIDRAGHADFFGTGGKPALVNVLTDPSVVYPRRANLA